MSHYSAKNFGGRMGVPDTRNPGAGAIPRQDNMQHAVAAVDPLVLRRTLLVSGTAGDVAREVKRDRRSSRA